MRHEARQVPSWLIFDVRRRKFAMLRYKSTTTRRYMWGIGTACSLVLLASTLSWAIEGRIGYRLHTGGSEIAGEIRKDDAPRRFWIVSSVCVATSIASVIVTGIGLSRVQRDEKESA